MVVKMETYKSMQFLQCKGKDCYLLGLECAYTSNLKGIGNPVYEEIKTPPNLFQFLLVHTQTLVFTRSWNDAHSLGIIACIQKNTQFLEVYYIVYKRLPYPIF